MKSYGRSSVSEFLGDFLVYRNLAPVDPRLPSLGEIQAQLGQQPGIIPRKSTPEYARVLVHLLKAAKKIESPKSTIERILYIGDTQLNDGQAFKNICRAINRPGIAFIAAENHEPNHTEIIDQVGDTLVLANRWSALYEFDHFCDQQNFHVDEHTTVLIDIDKTALGARGRNDHVIDHARVQAATQTVGELSGINPISEGFFISYSLLNQPEYHSFTTDNQDYLVYICLILTSDLFDLNTLIDDLRSGRLVTFQQFIDHADGLSGGLPVGIRDIHRDMYSRVKQGDPTPFKAFRHNEYRATAALLGNLDKSAPVEELLDREIVITQEVRAAALAWRDRGALLFGLSDKPDEASIPSPNLISQGYKPIHQISTDIVGE